MSQEVRTPWRLARIVVVQPADELSPVATDPRLPAPDPFVEPMPALDDDGLLRHRTGWVAIPDAQLPVLRLLLDRFQATVPDADLLAAISTTDEADARRKLSSAAHRLRARVQECGLSLSRIRGRGYLLDHQQATIMDPSDLGA